MEKSESIIKRESSADEKRDRAKLAELMGALVNKVKDPSCL